MRDIRYGEGHLSTLNAGPALHTPMCGGGFPPPRACFYLPNVPYQTGRGGPGARPLPRQRVLLLAASAEPSAQNGKKVVRLQSNLEPAIQATGDSWKRDGG